MTLPDLHGEIPVDSGRILLVDPVHLPDELVDGLTRPNAFGVTVGVLVATPQGDGAYPVYGASGSLVIADLYSPDGEIWAPAPADA